MTLLVPSGHYSGSGRTATAAVARGLHLTATPIFAIMALLSGLSGGGLPEGLCLTDQGASPLNGMVTMYLLMSVFHAAPWVTLLRPRRSSPVSAFACPAK